MSKEIKFKKAGYKLYVKINSIYGTFKTIDPDEEDYAAYIDYTTTTVVPMLIPIKQ